MSSRILRNPESHRFLIHSSYSVMALAWWWWQISKEEDIIVVIQFLAIKCSLVVVSLQ